MKKDKSETIKNSVIDLIIEHNNDYPNEEYLMEDESLDEQIKLWKEYHDALLDVIEKIRNIER